MVHRMAMIVTRMSLGYNFLADVNPLAAGAKSPEGERQWATRR
jgi:hypothetical protein